MNTHNASRWRVAGSKRSGLLVRSVTSGCLAAMAILNLTAADPQLSTRGLSPRGNLSFTVTGTAGATALVESSPNLADWSAVGSVVLTNGSASFFLPPGEDFAFLRTRIVEAAALPSAPAITPRVNPDFVKSRFESGDGQTVRFLDDGGYTYEVLLTADALADSSVLQFEVVNQATGFPAGWNYLTGIQISPFAAALIGESTVTITAPAGVTLGTVAAVAWSTLGSEVHLVPFTANGSQVVIPLHHLGGFGLCRFSGTPSGPIADARPSDSVASLEQKVALAQLRGTLAQRHFDSPLGGGRGTPKRPTVETEAAVFWEEQIQSLVTPRLRSALYSDQRLEQGLREYNMISEFLDPLLANPVNTGLQKLVLDTDALALRALSSSIERAFARCQPGNVKALIRLYRDIRWTRRGRISRAISLADRSRFKDLLTRAGRFKLEVLSSTAYSLAGIITTGVSSEFTLGFNETDFGSGRKARITGTAPIVIDTTQWANPPGGCSAQSAPAPGTVAVHALSINSSDLDIDSHIVFGDDSISAPEISLEWDPFTTAPGEHYVITCAGFAVPQPGSFWAEAFGALHKSEIQKTADGRQVFFIKSVGFDGRRDYHKEYQQIGPVGSGSASESTDLRISYLGVAN